MPAYNFQAWKASRVESGELTQTIRKKRKRPTVLGDIIYLYFGMRTKKCRKLGEGDCISVQDFILYGRELFKIADIDIPAIPWGDGDKLAKKDGFDTWEDFVNFFEKEYGLPFLDAEIIRWRKTV